MRDNARRFYELATEAAIAMDPDQKVTWFCRHLHLDPDIRERLPASALHALDTIFDALGGDPVALRAKRSGVRQVDFVLRPSGQVVEFDEVQHFTTARAQALTLDPDDDTPLGFDLDRYRQITETWKTRGDKGFAHKSAAEFPGPAGRQRQRAFFDTYRDLVAPHLGTAPLIRIACPDNDYRVAVDELVARVRGDQIESPAP
jgi:hypothetical protein